MFDLGFPFLQGMEFLLCRPTRLNPRSENFLEEPLSSLAGLLEVTADLLDTSDHGHLVVLADPACVVEGLVVVGGVSDGFEDCGFEYLRRDLLHRARVLRAFVEAGTAVVEVPTAVSIAARRGQVKTARASKFPGQEKIVLDFLLSVPVPAFAMGVDHLSRSVEHKLVNNGLVLAGGDDLPIVEDVPEVESSPQHFANHRVGKLAAALLALASGVVALLAVPILVEPRGDAVDGAEFEVLWASPDLVDTVLTSKLRS